MIKLENTEVNGWETAIRGLRTSTNSGHMSDSFVCVEEASVEQCKKCRHYTEDLSKCPITGTEDVFIVGPKDYELLIQLANLGSFFARFGDMIAVFVDITAPIYFWNAFKEFGVGITADPRPILSRIHNKKFELDDFSCENLFDCYGDPSMNLNYAYEYPKKILYNLICALNRFREEFNYTHDRKYLQQIIQLLPSSYNYTQTVMLTYTNLADIYYTCRDSELDEFKEFRKWIKDLPYSRFITGEEDEE